MSCDRRYAVRQLHLGGGDTTTPTPRGHERDLLVIDVDGVRQQHARRQQAVAVEQADGRGAEAPRARAQPVRVSAACMTMRSPRACAAAAASSSGASALLRVQPVHRTDRTVPGGPSARRARTCRRAP
jgi:hypothetical protein